MAHKVCALYWHVHGAYFIAQMTMNTRLWGTSNAYGSNNTHQPINGTFHAKIITKGSVQKQAGNQKDSQRDTAYP
ncbi:MAG: hypothetical protein J6Y85_02280 [Alphaproteobacteria bacterium]|nr:hypothetical protein [Alphaproteobacteria bacterium]